MELFIVMFRNMRNKRQWVERNFIISVIILFINVRIVIRFYSYLSFANENFNTL
jgi:hypothetical protein